MKMAKASVIWSESVRTIQEAALKALEEVRSHLITEKAEVKRLGTETFSGVTASKDSVF